MERSLSSTPLPSIGHELQPIQARTAEPGSVADATLRLVIEKHNRFYLNTIPFDSSDPASVVMEKIRAKWEEFFTQISLCKPLHDLLWMYSIDIVTMCTFRSDLEGQPVFSEVIIRAREPCLELSFGYKRPSLLHPTEQFSRQYPDVLTDSLGGKALLVGQRLKKGTVLWFSLVSLIVAVAIGVVVGVLVHDANVGTQIAGGIIGAIALLVSLSIWITHEGSL
ncbi:hypothetical protein UCREL1_5530 [Eutypa lata UCREL1]|uniref:Uncharacterized protein n=1 Tax=Eutypa lata (strain UCR-EL1) TaxID=1287681 RepID=M7ST72_EUTLA|nr:hypothetical protein UCREL1_5530 [Eutypa lata UCREL1]